LSWSLEALICVRQEQFPKAEKQGDWYGFWFCKGMTSAFWPELIIVIGVV
jgi:hypothetical protein